MRAALMSSFSVIIILAIGWPAWSQDIPNLNVDPVCHGIAQQAANPSETGDPDLAFAQCVKSEQSMRQKLTGEWSSFAPTDKTNCIASEMGGMVSYTDLVSCLEMARDARKLNTH